MKKADIEQRTEELVMSVIKDKDYELWDTEYVKEGSEYYLRVYLDKPGGITIDDCVEVTRALDPMLDAEDFVEEAYILEVSSPGLTRKLRKDRDFEKSIGRLVYVKLYKPVDGSKEYIGRLRSFDANEITIEEEGSSKENETNASIKLERDNIATVRLEFEE